MINPDRPAESKEVDYVLFFRISDKASLLQTHKKQCTTLSYFICNLSSWFDWLRCQ